VRLNLARAKRAGLRIERVQEFASMAAEMARLWRLTHLRSTAYQREVLGPDYFENLAARLGDRTFATFLWLGSRLVGFTLYLLDDTVLVPSYIGIDYAYNDEAALVFNAYYDASPPTSLSCALARRSSGWESSFDTDGRGSLRRSPWRIGG
jgi:hypothetical protein